MKFNLSWFGDTTAAAATTDTFDMANIPSIPLFDKKKFQSHFFLSLSLSRIKSESTFFFSAFDFHSNTLFLSLAVAIRSHSVHDNMMMTWQTRKSGRDGKKSHITFHINYNQNSIPQILRKWHHKKCENYMNSCSAMKVPTGNFHFRHIQQSWPI